MSSDQKKRIQITPSDKSSKKIKGTSYPITVDNYKDEGFKISPFFLMGAFISALGAGFLINPNSNGLNAPAFEVWSLIIIGIIIAIPGVFQMVRDYLRSKKNSK